MPFLTMRELWGNAGRVEGSRSRAPGGWKLPAWWLAYIGSAAGGVVALVAILGSMFHSIIERSDAYGPGSISVMLSAASIHAARLWLITADALHAMAAGLALSVVLTISRREDAIGLVGALPPAPPRPDL